MAASITLSINLGPLVSLKVSGQSCQELAQALEGYNALNAIIDSMCGDLAERIYPEGMGHEGTASEGSESPGNDPDRGYAKQPHNPKEQAEQTKEPQP